MLPFYQGALQAVLIEKSMDKTYSASFIATVLADLVAQFL